MATKNTKNKGFSFETVCRSFRAFLWLLRQWGLQTEFLRIQQTTGSYQTSVLNASRE